MNGYVPRWFAVMLAGLLLGVIVYWGLMDKRPSVAPAAVTVEHRFKDLRMTCLEFRWYANGSKLVYPPIIVCQNDKTLIETLIAAAYLSGIIESQPNLSPDTGRSN